MSEHMIISQDSLLWYMVSSSNVSMKTHISDVYDTHTAHTHRCVWLHVPFIEILSSDAIHCNTIVLINELHEILTANGIDQTTFIHCVCWVYFSTYIIESTECTRPKWFWTPPKKQHLLTCLCARLCNWRYILSSHLVSVLYSMPYVLYLCVCIAILNMDI